MLANYTALMGQLERDIQIALEDHSPGNVHLGTPRKPIKFPRFAIVTASLEREMQVRANVETWSIEVNLFFPRADHFVNEERFLYERADELMRLIKPISYDVDNLPMPSDYAGITRRIYVTSVEPIETGDESRVCGIGLSIVATVQNNYS